MTHFIHEAADVGSSEIGGNTRIWQYVVVLEGAVIGADCNLCSHVFVESDVVIGDRVTIKSGVQLWDGLRVEDDVFIGPNATFTNDAFPRSGQRDKQWPVTRVRQGASIGANATILPGREIGARAMVGAGAVVTRNVPPGAIVTGNPAVITGYVDAHRPAASGSSDAIPGTSRLPDSSIEGVRLQRLKAVQDLRGDLSVTDVEREIPFPVKRVFWVYNVPSERVRGAHVHLELQEFLVCVAGSCKVVLDDGKRREEYLLDDPSLGLVLPPRVWRSLYGYSGDAVLLVFASHEYDPDDYVREYDRFLEMAGRQE